VRTREGIWTVKNYQRRGKQCYERYVVPAAGASKWQALEEGDGNRGARSLKNFILLFQGVRGDGEEGGRVRSSRGGKIVGETEKALPSWKLGKLSKRKIGQDY